MHHTDLDAGRRGWRALLGPDHVGSIVVLAGGVALYATNVHLTAAVLPSAVADIGGERFYAWATTVFLVASVISAALVSRLLTVSGSRTAYLVAIGGFTAGTLVCAAAATMPVLLAGRALQGAGGGLLSGLGYALIRSQLPKQLWTRASALVSGTWAVGVFVGPALGGAFAQIGAWRLAFVALAAAGIAVGALVPRYLAGGRPGTPPPSVPVLSMLALAAAALLVSVASVAPTGGWTATALAAAGALIAVFVAHEHRTGGRVLPAVTFTVGGTLAWTYLTIAVLAAVSTADAFVPLFGQRLGGLAPLAAGFLGAVLAVGWTLGEVSSAGAAGARAVRAVLVGGTAAVVAGFAILARTADAPVVPWVLGLLLVGTGVGVCWPHLSASAMGASADPAEADRAAAAINTVQLMANAVGSAVAGVLVNLGGSPTGSARLLFAVFAAIAGLGVLTAIRASRHRA
ncbi:MFS transporter [Rhodococcus olei]|uniref:MFS transporter n=1 Tax=Rhodococcus olei TaxID=2161675 RepID=A0ABP8PNX5_9NOCA